MYVMVPYVEDSWDALASRQIKHAFTALRVWGLSFWPLGAKAVEVGGFEMTSTQLVGATAAAALLSIAAVAERKALKRYCR